MNEEVVATSFEECLEALGHVERRRLLLALLNDASGGPRTVAFDQLGSGGADETSRRFMRHVHLPKLEKMGFIHADRQQRSVTTGPQFEALRPLLELLDNNQGQFPDGWV